MKSCILRMTMYATLVVVHHACRMYISNMCTSSVATCER